MIYIFLAPSYLSKDGPVRVPASTIPDFAAQSFRRMRIPASGMNKQTEELHNIAPFSAPSGVDVLLDAGISRQ